MKKLILMAVLVMGCASSKELKMEKYRLATEDVCRDNPHEVLLAQLLYLEMKNE